MAKVEIYTSIICPYCIHAVNILTNKNIDFEQIDITTRNDLRETMCSRANGSTSVPQIFIDGTHIGGCNELVTLDSAGHLEKLSQGIA